MSDEEKMVEKEGMNTIIIDVEEDNSDDNEG